MKNGRPDNQSPKRDFPTAFQRKWLWAAITGTSLLSVGGMVVFVIWLVARVLQFLQPVLVPIAFAGILAYLLEPLVKKLVRRGVPHFRAMMLVWSGFHVTLLILFISVAVPTVSEGSRFVMANQDRWADNLGGFLSRTLVAIDSLASRFSGEQPIDPDEVEDEAAGTGESGAVRSLPDPDGSLEDADFADPPKAVSPASPHARARIRKWVEDNGQEISRRVINFLSAGFQGFLGLFGYLVGFILVPLYLYYFLKESEAIKRNWSNYIPLRASKFRAEVVDVLSEVNSYLVAFFRGQMLVSLIDGVLVGVSLTIIGLPYAMLIGVFVALLGLIPYVGNLLCWFAAVMISIAHFGRTDAAGNLINTFAGIGSIWAYPVLVTAIFVVVQKINSMVTAPRIVGDAVGLHPLTVIFSVLFWSLLIGGVLGALLAVPLTASVKVLFRRYIWERRVQSRIRGLDSPQPAG